MARNRVHVKQNPDSPLAKVGIQDYNRLPASDGGKPISADLWDAYVHAYNALMDLGNVIAEQVGDHQ